MPPEDVPTTGVLDTWSRKLQYVLDKSSPLVLYRWIFCSVVLSIYCLRVYYLNGWFIVTYGLGIYLLNQLIGFLSPQVDPEETDIDVGLPTREKEEFRPFARRLPEFKFWYSCTRAVVMAGTMTFFELFNVPVFWPILLLYFIVLFVITMKRQIRHMIKYRYVPFSWGKAKYVTAGNKSSAADKK
mmetsp:Transcript_24232/g.33224  ORF Transcript_24232/g.33224 Transcript_24232/m.33224 type:complete len:185 (-) Transcript_24232:74-628(-)